MLAQAQFTEVQQRQISRGPVRILSEKILGCLRRFADLILGKIQLDDFQHRLPLAFGGHSWREVWFVSFNGRVKAAKPFEQAGAKSGALGLKAGLRRVRSEGKQVVRLLQRGFELLLRQKETADQVLPLPGELGQQKLAQWFESFFRRAKILLLHLRLAQQQVTARDQLVGRIGVGGILKNSVRLLQQVDHLRPLLEFGQRGGLADGSLEA